MGLSINLSPSHATSMISQSERGVATAFDGRSAGAKTTEKVACWYLNRNEHSNAACEDAKRQLVSALSAAGGDAGGGFAVSQCNASAASCSTIGAAGPPTREKDCMPMPCAVVAFTSASGLLYSVHTVAAALLRGDAPQNEVAVPHLEYRALKLNLPWSP